MPRRLKKVPEFASEAEERAFWESPKNDSTEYVDWSEAKVATLSDPGYDERFRKSVEEALADPSPGVPHEQAMEEFRRLIRRARENKNRATILP